MQISCEKTHRCYATDPGLHHLHGRRVTCDSNFGSLTTQGHLRLVGVTDDSKLGSLVPTGFFKGNTFRVKNGANSPALGGDTGTWGLGVGLGDNLYEIWGQLFRGLGQGDLGFRGGTGLGTTLMRFGDSSLGFGGWDKGTWSLGVGLGWGHP